MSESQTQLGGSAADDQGSWRRRMLQESGADVAGSGAAAGVAGDDGDEDGDVDFTDMLKYSTVKQVTRLLAPNARALPEAFMQMNRYTEQPIKNAITPDDPEHGFLKECSALVLKIEVEKSKAFKFLRDHYAARFPELVALVQDALTYAKVVRIVSNSMDLTGVVEELLELGEKHRTLSSHTIAAVIAAASTTKGRELDEAELYAVMEASDEIVNLENAKQVMLEYIQTRMPLVAPNLCAFLGSAITSQMFALVGSVEGIAKLDSTAMIKLGAKRANSSGIDINMQGFIANSPLVASHPPELRPKALRLVAAKSIELARIDANRRASDDTSGRKSRTFVRNAMIRWTDPLVKRGRAYNIYDRKARKRAESGPPKRPPPMSGVRSGGRR